MPATRGLHHVTAIAGDPSRNLDFYTRTLGLRLVKKTVNFDDPGTYHLYYADASGTPGSILTFFPWPDAAQGHAGTGEAGVTALLAPQSALGFWTARLIEYGVVHGAIETRFGARLLPFRDPDGMRLELVFHPEAAVLPCSDGPAPAEHAIRGLDGVTLSLTQGDRTAKLLIEGLSLERLGRDGDVERYAAPRAALGGNVDIRTIPGGPRGRSGAGSVHHVAFRASDDAEQAAFAHALAGIGVAATEQKDRAYFRSIYFREPGGVLFEIATDAPGFAIDEAPDALGRRLALPPQYEADRPRIEAALAPLD